MLAGGYAVIVLCCGLSILRLVWWQCHMWPCTQIPAGYRCAAGLGVANYVLSIAVTLDMYRKSRVTHPAALGCTDLSLWMLIAVLVSFVCNGFQALVMDPGVSFDTAKCLVCFLWNVIYMFASWEVFWYSSPKIFGRRYTFQFYAM